LPSGLGYRAAGNLSALNGSFRRTLHTEDKSERTVKSYTEAVTLFTDFLSERGHPLTVEAVARDDVRAFIADQLERWKPLTALNRYRASRRSSSGRWPKASWTPARWPA
jgi:site-specific recombinase XerD